ncbi:hypothetical protein ECZU03_57550 [Escherichia coli]|nr:hypothetical protein ECZU03_57550 [Escherichia coli]
MVKRWINAAREAPPPCYSAERELYGTATLQHYGGGLEYLVIGLELGAGHQCSPSVWVGAEAVAAAAIVAN